MKRLKHALLATAMLASAIVVPAAAAAKAPEGSWIQDNRGYWYKFADGGWAKSEYVNGYWIRKNGYWDGGVKFGWHSNNYGYWWGTADGSWYAKNTWQKIDGKWYYFDARGYMAKNEYIGGYWVGANGAWNPGYSHGHWVRGTGDNEGKWWYMDNVGSSGAKWYPTDKWLRIDGYSYYFDEDGWMLQDTVQELMCDPYGKDGAFAYLSYYAFEHNGQLGEYTKFKLDDEVEATLKFMFDGEDDDAKFELAMDMDAFIYFTLDEGQTKTMNINGTDREVSIGTVEELEVTMIDGQSIYDWMDTYAQDQVTITGIANTKKVVEALSIGTVANCADYMFEIELDDIDINALFVEDDQLAFAAGDGIYYGMVSCFGDDVYLLLAHDVADDLGVELVTNGVITNLNDEYANAVVVDSATGAETYYTLIPHN